MKGDNTRDTFAREKHYHAVRLQQGRVQMDADWNEFADILEHASTTTATDLAGGAAAVPTGPTAPLVSGGFRTGGFAINATTDQATPAPSGTNLLIAPGRMYVDGILCETGRSSAYSFTNQPDLPGATLPSTNGLYAVYLDVWSRHVGPIEDPSVRDVALGGADTATRSQRLAQVKLVPDAQFAALTAAPTGQLVARVTPSTSAANPCDLNGAGGFNGLENQLYRVEIHRGNASPLTGTATFKWSRDNGSVVAAIREIVSDGTIVLPTTPPTPVANVLVLESPPADEGRFNVGSWVELLDDRLELAGTPGQFLKITDVDGTRLVFDTTNIRDENGNVASGGLRAIDLAAHPRIRRWDGVAVTGVTPINSTSFLPLESGIEIQFPVAGGTYRNGDFWVIPARAGIGIEWPSVLTGSPPTPQPTARSPRGIIHHFTRLATVRLTGTTFDQVADARRRLPPLTGLLADDVAFTSIPGVLELPPPPAPQTVNEALRVLGSRSSPAPKLRESVSFVNNVQLTNNTANTVFQAIPGASSQPFALNNLNLSQVDASGRVPVLVRFYMGAVRPTRGAQANLLEADVEYRLVLTPASGPAVVLAQGLEIYLAPSGSTANFEARHVFLERLLVGATNGLLPGTYSFSVDWSIKSPQVPSPITSIAVQGCLQGSAGQPTTTRELIVMEM